MATLVGQGFYFYVNFENFYMDSYCSTFWLEKTFFIVFQFLSVAFMQQINSDVKLSKCVHVKPCTLKKSLVYYNITCAEDAIIPTVAPTAQLTITFANVQMRCKFRRWWFDNRSKTNDQSLFGTGKTCDHITHFKLCVHRIKHKLESVT